jgi:hypothetical protein
VLVEPLGERAPPPPPTPLSMAAAAGCESVATP